MKKFESAATRGVPIIAGASSRPATRKGLLARIIEALHESRRLEAARLLAAAALAQECEPCFRTRASLTNAIFDFLWRAGARRLPRVVDGPAAGDYGDP